MLGTPSPNEVNEMNPAYENTDFPEFEAIPLHVQFKDLEIDAVRLLSKVFQYSP